VTVWRSLSPRRPVELPRFPSCSAKSVTLRTLTGRVDEWACAVMQLDVESSTTLDTKSKVSTAPSQKLLAQPAASSRSLSACSRLRASLGSALHARVKRWQRDRAAQG
jgi:hypothetical protein